MAPGRDKQARGSSPVILGNPVCQKAGPHGGHLQSSVVTLHEAQLPKLNRGGDYLKNNQRQDWVLFLARQGRPFHSPIFPVMDRLHPLMEYTSTGQINVNTQKRATNITNSAFVGVSFVSKSMTFIH